VSIYRELKALNIPIDHHESDLYAKVTPESKAIIDKYRKTNHITSFTSRIDKATWYEIPFAFEPFWEAKRK
jgi:hypothetical protein